MSGGIAAHIILLALVLAGCGNADTPSPFALPTLLPAQATCRFATDPESLCVLVLGDSIAAGVPLSGRDRWWAKVEDQVAVALPKRPIAVESWAVPGGGIDVLESAAAQPALDSYDAAIVFEGVNDVGFVPLAKWTARYEAAVVSMESRGLIVIIGTPPPSFEDGEFKTRYDAVASVLRGVADRDRPLLDIAARWHSDGAALAATYYSDLIHQGAVGQSLMADLARETLLAAVKANAE